MGKCGYSGKQEPAETGSAGPDAEVLGAVWPTGRTGLATPPHSFGSVAPSGSDASTESFRLTYFDPQAGLECHVLALFHFEWNETEIADRHPGALGQLFLTPLGSGEIQFGDRVDQVDRDAHMFSGFEVATPFRMKGPWHSIGASLSPLGWAALAQTSAKTNLNRVVPACDVLGDEINGFAGTLNEQYRQGKVSGEAACQALARWIKPRLKPIPHLHKALIEKTIAWFAASLNPDVETLFASVHYSRRQTERLVAQYFGLSPASLARKMRAVRAAHFLAQANITDAGEAEIASAFYDQSHMIREIRRYCGYTPTRLGGAEEPLFQTMLRMKNLDRLKQFRTIGGSDLP